MNTVTTNIPIMGFLEIQNVNEDNICDTMYELKNILVKPNNVEEHSIYIEMEVGVKAFVYEEKQINLIQDLYSPCENLEFDRKKIQVLDIEGLEEELFN